VNLSSACAIDGRTFKGGTLVSLTFVQVKIYLFQDIPEFSAAA
jgi:hypothetical protein